MIPIRKNLFVDCKPLICDICGELDWYGVNLSRDSSYGINYCLDCLDDRIQEIKNDKAKQKERLPMIT